MLSPQGVYPNSRFMQKIRLRPHILNPRYPCCPCYMMVTLNPIYSQRLRFHAFPSCGSRAGLGVEGLSWSGERVYQVHRGGRGRGGRGRAGSARGKGSAAGGSIGRPVTNILARGANTQACAFIYGQMPSDGSPDTQRLTASASRVRSSGQAPFEPYPEIPIPL